MDFATDGTGPFALTAFEGGVPVGSVVATGTIRAVFQYPQGSITCGVTFGSIELTAPSTPHLEIDNVGAAIAAPEPTSLEAAQQRAMAGRPKVGGFLYLDETLQACRCAVQSLASAGLSEPLVNKGRAGREPRCAAHVGCTKIQPRCARRSVAD